MQNEQCGCERGGDCTKTTVCAIASVTEDLDDQVEALQADLLTLARRLVFEDTTTFSPECDEVMSRWRQAALE